MAIFFQDIWSKRDCYETKDGDKVHYRCNKVKKHGMQCPAAVYLLYHAEKETVTLFKTDEEHDHQEKTPSRGLPLEIRSAIEHLYEDGK